MNDQDGKADLINAVNKGKVNVTEVDTELLDVNTKAANACPMQIIKIGDVKN